VAGAEGGPHPDPRPPADTRPWAGPSGPGGREAPLRRQATGLPRRGWRRRLPGHRPRPEPGRPASFIDALARPRRRWAGGGGGGVGQEPHRWGPPWSEALAASAGGGERRLGRRRGGGPREGLPGRVERGLVCTTPGWLIGGRAGVGGKATFRLPARTRAARRARQSQAWGRWARRRRSGQPPDPRAAPNPWTDALQRDPEDGKAGEASGTRGPRPCR